MDWTRRLPDGVHIERHDGQGFVLGVALPSHEGLHMLVCPVEPDHRFAVELIFAGAGQRTSSQVHCAYCGHQAGPDSFLSPQTRRRLQEAAEAVAYERAADQLATMLRGVARRSRGTLQYKPASRSAPPRRIFSFDQEATLRTMTCRVCQETTAVFGIALFCPTCGQRAPDEQFAELVGVQRAVITTLADLSDGQRARLEAAGGLTSIYESAIKDVCAALETLLRDVFHRDVPNPDAVLKTAKQTGNVFQRLDDAAVLYRDHLHRDLPAALGDGWTTLTEGMTVRHVLTHNAGLVDARYLTRVPHATQTVGQRVHVGLRQVLDLLDAATALGTLLAPTNP